LRQDCRYRWTRAEGEPHERTSCHARNRIR
jgi:hypothetical protein